MSMVGEEVVCVIKQRRVKMRVVESNLIFEPNRRGFVLVMRRPKGVILFDGWLPIGSEEVVDVRESAQQLPDVDRSLRGF